MVIITKNSSSSISNGRKRAKVLSITTLMLMIPTALAVLGVLWLMTQTTTVPPPPPSPTLLLRKVPRNSAQVVVSPLDHRRKVEVKKVKIEEKKVEVKKVEQQQQQQQVVPTTTTATTKKKNNNNNNHTIAYAISLIKCGDKQTTSAGLTDAALILQHSIHLISSRSNNGKSKYDYRMIAIVHRQAVECSSVLKQVGFEIVIVDPPVQQEQIQGEHLKKTIHKEWCCGHRKLCVTIDIYVILCDVCMCVYKFSFDLYYILV